MTDQRFITIASASPPISVTAMRGLTPPVPAGGYGGWGLVERPKRKSLTVWAGIEPRRVLVPLRLGITPAGDALTRNVSAEPDRTRLERMAQPAQVGAEPPIVTVVGAVPHGSVPWVIESLDWDPAPIYSPRGFIVRQDVTVHLLEHVKEDILGPETAASQTRKKAATASQRTTQSTGGTSNQAPQQKTYTVKAGDTLQKIAAAELGNYTRWFELGDLNDVIDGNRLIVGQRLRLP